jgi:hypothetical protein
VFDGVTDVWNSHSHDITKSILRQRGQGVPAGEF